VRIAESRWNLGFPGGCNLGRAEARGELIVLLHDDAEAEPRWLPALVDAAERHPGAGIIASRVLSSDGSRLRMAGGVLFSDTSAAHIGVGAEPEAPEHMLPRPVDYSSSCSMLVRARTWDAIGGAEEQLFPGGYVDADLCVGAWAAGWEVRYEPLAAARHPERGSTTAGFKAFAYQRSRDRFRTKWAGELDRYEPAAADAEAATERALARAQARADELRSRPVAPGEPARTPAADPDLGPRLATLELRLLREYVAIVDTELAELQTRYTTTHHELDRVHAEYASAHAELERVRERAKTLDAILAGGWWRLRTRLLPLIGLGRRLRRGHRNRD
jgi:hypothetical protein